MAPQESLCGDLVTLSWLVLLNAVGGSSLEDMTLRGIFVGGLFGFALSFGCASAQTAPSPSPTPSPAATPDCRRDAQSRSSRRLAPAARRVDHRRRAADDRDAAGERRAAARERRGARADGGRGRSRFADPGRDPAEAEKEAAAAAAAVGNRAVDRPVADVSARYVHRDLQGRRALRGDRAGRRLADRHPGVAPRRHRPGGREVAQAPVDRRRPRRRRRRSTAPPRKSGAPN